MNKKHEIALTLPIHFNINLYTFRIQQTYLNVLPKI